VTVTAVGFGGLAPGSMPASPVTATDLAARAFLGKQSPGANSRKLVLITSGHPEVDFLVGPTTWSRTVIAWAVTSAVGAA
jgi:hypothetical protein